jgi:hypothetical protein
MVKVWVPTRIDKMVGTIWMCWTKTVPIPSQNVITRELIDAMPGVVRVNITETFGEKFIHVPFVSGMPRQLVHTTSTTDPAYKSLTLLQYAEVVDAKAGLKTSDAGYTALTPLFYTQTYKHYRLVKRHESGGL